MRLAGHDDPAADAELVLHVDGLLECLHLLLAAEEEEVPDALDADVGPGAGGERPPGLQTALPQPDVERIRELGANPADRLARRTRRRFVALQNQDVPHPGLGQVEGDARSDDATADDDDLSAVNHERAVPSARHIAVHRGMRRNPVR